jgi:biopolymer transport protein ExbD
MPRVKVARKSTAIDMTAMCDVAFLLLTFFILSAKPKIPDPVKTDIPASTAIAAIPDFNFSTILVSHGKVYFNTSPDLRQKTLEAMADKYKIGLTPEEVRTFTKVEFIGVPMTSLRQFLELPEKDRDAYNSQSRGVPVDTTDNNELYWWVHSARLAAQYEHNKELGVGLKGDGDEKYPAVADVISSLQKQHVNRFSLITSLKTSK